jgi:glycine cleavage system transcriptional repressor
MPQHAILTAIGPDRPGIVDEVSQFIFQRGGNIADSRMVNLRGQFAMMVLLGAEDEAMGKIQAEMGQLGESSRLHVELRPAGPPNETTRAAEPAMPYRLTATAIDQAGIVHRLSHLLREMGVNIESLETRLMPAPITGAPLFEMEMTLAVPRSIQVSRLRQSLAGVCDEMNIDWQLASAG